MSAFLKKLVGGVALTTAAYYGTILPHTAGLQLYTNFVSRYRAGSVVPLTSKTEILIQEVLDDLKLPEGARKLLKPFPLAGATIAHAGTFVTPYGAVLGIPVNFDYTDVESVDKSNIIITDDPLDTSIIEGKLLINSLVLTENAQKFAIASEILKLLQNEPCRIAFGAAYSTAMFYIIYNILNRIYKFYLLSRFKRFLLIQFTSVFAFTFWLGYKDWISYKNNLKIDERLVELGPNYVEGGKEYFEKLLKKNQALRVLYNSRGPFFFKKDGNHNNCYLPRKELKLTDRLEFYKKKLNTTMYQV